MEMIYIFVIIQKEITYVHELIAFSSLDLVDSTEWSNNNMYLKNLDKFNEYSINCMITPGSNLSNNYNLRNEIFVYS